jgi:hypothetical protein
MRLEMGDEKALDELKLSSVTRRCCRGMMFTHIDLTKKMISNQQLDALPLSSTWNPTLISSSSKSCPPVHGISSSISSSSNASVNTSQKPQPISIYKKMS